MIKSEIILRKVESWKIKIKSEEIHIYYEGGEYICIQTYIFIYHQD